MVLFLPKSFCSKLKILQADRLTKSNGLKGKKGTGVKRVKRYLAWPNSKKRLGSRVGKICDSGPLYDSYSISPLPFHCNGPACSTRCRSVFVKHNSNDWSDKTQKEHPNGSKKLKRFRFVRVILHLRVPSKNRHPTATCTVPRRGGAVTEACIDSPFEWLLPVALTLVDFLFHDVCWCSPAAVCWLHGLKIVLSSSYHSVAYSTTSSSNKNFWWHERKPPLHVSMRKVIVPSVWKRTVDSWRERSYVDQAENQEEALPTLFPPTVWLHP